jgi:hypothetical protein
LFSFILVVCFAGVFSLTPLILYLLWLSIVTRRRRPTIIAGPWDFAILLAGLSGFILFGGGLLLSLMQSNVRFLFRGNFEALQDAWAKEHLAWVLTVLAYLLFVVGGSLLAMKSRRHNLVVYNVDTEQFEALLSEVFDHLGHPIERRGNLWVGGMPLCEVDSFPAGHTVTLRWVSEDLLLFQDVDRQLREAIRMLAMSENPASRWFTSAVFSCALVVVFFVLLILFNLRKL